MLSVSVIGAGYVGLVTGTCLAEIGHQVICVDSDESKIARLRIGVIPIYEPGLEPLVAINSASGRLSFTNDLGEALGANILMLFVAVGTPMVEDGTLADLRPLYSSVEQAARRRRELAQGRDHFMVLVIKSTVPVGTCQSVHSIAARFLPEGSFAIASNPEFLREGSALKDFMEPDRIVVGSASPRALSLLKALYAPLIGKGHALVTSTSVETTELIKYAANTFLATRIALINELARLCEQVGADIEELSIAVGLDQRIGGECLRAGPGFGGSCFPKDLRALVASAAAFGSPLPVAEAVIESNERQKRAMTEKILHVIGGDGKGRLIAVLGLSFKANTDDVREAPALTIIPELVAAGATVIAFDPAARVNAQRALPSIQYALCAEDALRNADAVVIMTEWKQFQDLDWDALRLTMRRPLIIDLRNTMKADQMLARGYEYRGLGRGRSSETHMLPWVQKNAGEPAETTLGALEILPSGVVARRQAAQRRNGTAGFRGYSRAGGLEQKRPNKPESAGVDHQRDQGRRDAMPNSLAGEEADRP